MNHLPLFDEPAHRENLARVVDLAKTNDERRHRKHLDRCRETADRELLTIGPISDTSREGT